MTEYGLNHLRPVHPARLPLESIRGQLLQLLGLEPTPARVDFTAETPEETSDGLRLSRVRYANSLGETVPGILLTPLDAEPRSLAGIVCMPGTTQSAETLAQPHFYRENRPAGWLIGWGRELARRGFATLCISPKGSEPRRGSPEHWHAEAKRLTPYGRTQMGVGVEEALLGARLLAEQACVDRARLGLTGFSLGGNFTWYAMACAPWIRAGVPVCGGVGTLASVIHEADIARHSFYYFIPHMLRYFDHPQVVATCITPRPFMLVAPTMDEDMPHSGVEALIETVEPVYRSLGYPDHFKVYQPETNHTYSIESFEWVVAWFKRFL